MRRMFTGMVPVFILLFAAVTASRGASADRWVEARSSHFVVLTDSSERDARHLASQLERMHMVFHTLFPTKSDDTDLPIMVLALKDRKDMQALEPVTYLEKKQIDLAGFFVRVPEKNYILLRLDAQQEHAYATVYHEYTHYMLRKADGWLPLWLNEGLAQFYENTDIDEKNAWLGQANPDELRFLNRNDLLPVATLLAVDSKSPYYHDEEKGSIFYAESWALTHFLVVSDRLQGTHRLHNYTESLAHGEDAVTAAQHAFGDLDKLQQSLSDYMMQRKFMYFLMPADLAAKDAVVESHPVAAADADAVRADVLLYTGRAKESRELVETVLRDDPKNALAHETMGILRYRDGDAAAAKRWFGEAMGLDSHSYLARYYFAVAALRGGSREEDEAIESNLHASIALNPEFALADDALAMFYVLRHRKLDDARELSLRAIELEPSRLSFRLNCAEVLTQQRKFADSLEVLQAAMHLARTPDEVAAVTSRVQRVERYQMTMAASLDGSSIRQPDRAGSVTGGVDETRAQGMLGQ